MVWRSLEQVNIVFLVAVSKHEHVPMADWSFSSCRKAVQHLDHQAQQHTAFSCNEMLDVLKSQTKLSALQNLNCYLFLRTPVSSCAKCIHGLARRWTPEFVKVQSQHLLTLLVELWWNPSESFRFVNVRCVMSATWPFENAEFRQVEFHKFWHKSSQVKSSEVR